MPKSPSSTDPHGHCEAQKVVGIDGSLVATQIRLKQPVGQSASKYHWWT